MREEIWHVLRYAELVDNFVRNFGARFLVLCHQFLQHLPRPPAVVRLSSMPFLIRHPLLTFLPTSALTHIPSCSTYPARPQFLNSHQCQFLITSTLTHIPPCSPYPARPPSSDSHQCHPYDVIPYSYSYPRHSLLTLLPTSFLAHIPTHVIPC